MSGSKEHESIRSAVQNAYGRLAAEDKSCCRPKSPCCDAANAGKDAALGYDARDLAALPQEAYMGLGCGNPVALADLKAGETVVDLGSGAGVDCFLAAREVGPDGQVIGVDMTEPMLQRARRCAAEGGYQNVAFRLGQIEHLPVADAVADVVLSNCVVNLSPDKPQVLADAFRVLKPGGRLAIWDIVATAEMPEPIRSDINLLCGCVSGAAPIDQIHRMLADAGFQDIRIRPNEASRRFIRQWAPDKGLEKYVIAASIQAAKPLA